jgi:hypothetical protein
VHRLHSALDCRKQLSGVSTQAADADMVDIPDPAYTSQDEDMEHAPALGVPMVDSMWARIG